MSVTYGDLIKGDWFKSPRASEGWVQVVCPFGACTHDQRDIFSCHIRQTNEWWERVEYFVLADPRDEAHVAESVLERLGVSEESIPCSSCGEPVYDDDVNAHIETQRIPCQEVSV